MRFGIAMFITADGHLGPVEIAKACEDRGFDILLVCEHGHIPLDHQSKYPNGGDLPPFYARGYDPFVATTAAAMATSRLRIGTGIALLAQRDAILTAKEVASVDQVSNGRFVFGIGGGWNLEEQRDHGIDPRQRFAIMRDKLLAIRQIWTNEVASYSGPHVSFGPMSSAPKPRQRPYPPVWVGGAGPSAIRLAAEVGDGWLPSVAVETELGAKVDTLHELAAAAGRDPVDVTGLIPLVVRARDAGPLVERCAAVGATGMILALAPVPEDRVLHDLDDFARLSEAWAPVR